MDVWQHIFIKIQVQNQMLHMIKSEISAIFPTEIVPKFYKF